MKKESAAVENHFMFNPFDVFGLEPSFNIDLKELDRAYFDLQKRHHPDHNHRDQLGVSSSSLSTEQDASVINASYQQLKNPLKRAEAILNILSLPLTEGEKDASDHSTILAGILEFQEALAMCEDEEEASAIKEEIEEAFVAEQSHFADFFDKGEYELLPEIYMKMNYLNRLREHMKDIEEQFFNRKIVLH